MSTQSAAPGRAVRHGAVTAAICIALAAVVAAMSSLNVAIPDIARATHASQTQLSWIIDAYSLVFAALLLPAGALGRPVRPPPRPDGRTHHLRRRIGYRDDHSDPQPS